MSIPENYNIIWSYDFEFMPKVSMDWGMPPKLYKYKFDWSLECVFKSINEPPTVVLFSNYSAN